MTTLYRNEGSDPKYNAQRNLSGRTHYVDDDTLRWHKSRIISARAVDNGLLFAIVTSDALDMNNTRRGFRFVIFDLFGNVIERTSIDSDKATGDPGPYRTSAAAAKAMWAKLNEFDARAITDSAIKREIASHAREMEYLREQIEKIDRPAA